MPGTTNELTYRYFDVERDFTSLVQMLAAVAKEDQKREVMGEEQLRDLFKWYDPIHNSWVVTTGEPEQLVAYGWLLKMPDDPHPEIFIVVQPDLRRQGIGSELLARALARSRELQAEAIDCHVEEKDQTTTAFVRKCGFKPVSAYTRLVVSGEQSFPMPEFPPGFTLRTYNEINDINVFVESCNLSYEGQQGHKHVSKEGVAKWLPELPSNGIVLLFAPDGAVAGQVFSYIDEQLSKQRGQPTGLIDAPGVVIQYRTLDLYRSQLLNALHHILPQHPAGIELESWGDAPETLEMYQQLGFTMMRQSISYRRGL